MYSLRLLCDFHFPSSGVAFANVLLLLLTKQNQKRTAPNQFTSGPDNEATYNCAATFRSFRKTKIQSGALIC